MNFLEAFRSAPSHWKITKKDFIQIPESRILHENRSRPRSKYRFYTNCPGLRIRALQILYYSYILGNESKVPIMTVLIRVKIHIIVRAEFVLQGGNITFAQLKSDIRVVSHQEGSPVVCSRGDRKKHFKIFKCKKTITCPFLFQVRWDNRGYFIHLLSNPKSVPQTGSSWHDCCTMSGKNS